LWYICIYLCICIFCLLMYLFFVFFCYRCTMMNKVVYIYNSCCAWVDTCGTRRSRRFWSLLALTDYLRITLDEPICQNKLHNHIGNKSGQNLVSLNKLIVLQQTRVSSIGLTSHWCHTVTDVAAVNKSRFAILRFFTENISHNNSITE